MHTILFARSPDSPWEEWLIEHRLNYIRGILQNRFKCICAVENYPKGVYVNKNQFTTSMPHQENGPKESDQITKEENCN